MPRFTLTISDDLHRQLKRHPEVDWGGVASRILAEKIEAYETMDRIAAKSKLTRADVDELDHMLKAGLLGRYRRAKP